VIVAERSPDIVLDAANVMTPVPLPFVVVGLSQLGSSEVAVQKHSLGATTLMVPVEFEEDTTTAEGFSS
jgi:hypothetical protein